MNYSSFTAFMLILIGAVFGFLLSAFTFVGVFFALVFGWMFKTGDLKRVPMWPILVGMAIGGIPFAVIDLFLIRFFIDSVVIAGVVHTMIIPTIFLLSSMLHVLYRWTRRVVKNQHVMV